jgi:hypothetical protein
MKSNLIIIGIVVFCNISCNKKADKKAENLPIIGTWQLQKATIVENGDTSVTDYSKNMSFIKIINESHFAFLSHTIPSKTDSSNTYSSGGGKYNLDKNTYTEHLEYCCDRAWEGHDFQFSLEINGDTLTQTGIEKIENAGVNRLNIEKYVRIN